jgi:hypothetical protein
MARTTRTIYTCDLHEADEVTDDVAEVSFAFDGSSYEIDLCPDHRTEMEEALATYVGSARRANRSGTSSPRRTTRAATGAGSGRASSGSDREEVQRIREWAREHGHKVSERGRLSSSVLEAYRAAQ